MINNNFSRLNESIKKQGFVLLFLLWILSQIIAYFHFGIVTSCDTRFYEENAVSLINGNVLENRALLYLSYIGLLSFFCLFNISIKWIIVIQLLVAALAFRCFYLIVLKLSKDVITALTACLLFVLWFKFQQWNLIVYTDAMFTNCIIITVYCLQSYKNKLQFIGVFLLIVFTTFIRPTGIGFLVALLSYSLYDNKFLKMYSLRTKILFLIIIGLVVLLILNYFLRGFVPDLIKGYSIVEIIYPKISLGVSRPEKLYVPKDTYQPIMQLFLFVVGNIGYMAKLFIIKLGLFLGHVKPYYSLAHNLFLASFLLPVYYFAIRGFKVIERGKVYAFIVVFIGFQTFTVAQTTENWDGRFLLPLLPWFFMLSAFGFLKSKYSRT